MKHNPFDLLHSEFSELAMWLKPLCRYNKDFEDYITADYKKPMLRLKLYTKEHQYNIAARLPNKDDGYLGCTAMTRKPRAGEDWNRGNDLNDGSFSGDTWNEILSDIVSYELVKVVKKPKLKCLDEGDEFDVLRKELPKQKKGDHIGFTLGKKHYKIERDE